MTGFELLVALFLISLVVESIVQAIKKATGLEKPMPSLWYGLAIAIGVAVCFLFKVNILGEVGLHLSYSAGAWLSKAVSGVLVGCFANFIHLVKKSLK